MESHKELIPTSILKQMARQCRTVLSPTERVTLALFILIHAFIFIFLFQSFYSTTNTDLSVFFAHASKLLSGLVPYRDFTLEYPPLSLVFFGVPRAITSSYDAYTTVYHYEVLAFDIIGLLLIFDIARRLGGASWKPLLMYTLGVLAVGPIILESFDIFPAVMTLAALYFFWLGKHKASWAMLALGTVTKIYPIAIAPIFLLIYFKNRQFKQIRDGLVVFLAVCLIVISPFIYLGSDSIVNLVSYHSQRGIQTESTYSAIILVLQKMGFTTVKEQFGFGSSNIVNAVTPAVAKLSTYVTGISLLMVYWFIYRQVKPDESQFPRLGAYVLLVIVTTLVTSKVLSPQYLIWLIPLFALICGRWRAPIMATFIVLGALTYYIFPWHYGELLLFHTNMVALLVIRNALLILLAVLAVIALRQMKASEKENPMS